ncbi:MAG: hypothetical protein KDA05_05640 [Phycisphaerales bacterium]|nr:hypothetical protein [Phycisphaerales bacterium]
MKRAARAVALRGCLLALGLAGLSACASDPTEGYSFETTYDHSVRTISVPIFQNSTFWTGVETELTEAIIAEIQRATPWRVTPERPGGGGDTTLSGVVQEVEITRLSTSRASGLVEEETVTVEVDFDWRDNRTGQVLLARRRFAAAGSFVPHRPTGDRIDVGRREAIQQLARDIVSELRSDW